MTWIKNEFLINAAPVSVGVFEIVAVSGRSAEHGVNKKGLFYPFAFRKDRTGLMRQIKQIFDPKGVMNPGKILIADEF
jgi:FAD/FMN-containing dehydrogenase